MATFSELRAKAHEISNRARVKLDEITPTTSKEDAAHIEAEFDRMIAEADALDARATKLEAIEARSAAYNAADPRRPLHDGEARQASRNEYEDVFLNFIRREGRADRLTGDQRSLIERGETRDGQVIGTASMGGYAVPTIIAKDVVVAMRAYGPFPNPAVCDWMATDTGAPITIVRTNDTSNMGHMIGEAVSANTASITLDTITLSAYKATTDVFKFSRELLQDSGVDLKSLVIARAAERMGRLINNKCTLGSGSGEPTGVMTAIGTPSLSTVANATVSFDDVISLYHSVDPAYRASPKTAFQFNDNTLMAIRKLKDNQGRPLWEPGFTAGDPGFILGKPYYINQDMASIASNAVAMTFGDWGQFTIRVSRTLEMAQYNELFAVSDQIGFQGYLRLDSNLVDTRAIKGLKVS